MKMFRLYIGTTDGPTEVQRVTPEDPEVRSVICLDGKAIALPISDDYDAFVRRPTGIVETLTGHPSYRVDISHPIGGGYSWQLGIAVAHLLDRNSCLAGPGDPVEEALWLTGEVDHNLDIGAVHDVGLKLTRATSMLKGLIAKGTHVTVAVPEDCADEARGVLAAAFPDANMSPRLVVARRLDDVLSAIGIRRRAKGSTLRNSMRNAGRNALGGLVLGAAGFAAILVTVAVWPRGGATEVSPPQAESTDKDFPVANFTGAPPHVSLIETRAPRGSHCAAVNFNRTKPVIARHLIAPPPTKAGFQANIDPRGLCDLRHRIINSGLGTVIIAAVAARHDDLGGQFRTRPQARDHILEPGATFDIASNPPSHLAQTLMQRLVIVAVPNNRREASSRLLEAVSSLAASNSPESWSRAVAELSRRRYFIARSLEVFRPGREETRKTGQTLP